MEAGVRLESALEIFGALRDRFGEPLTVTDICRAVPLSYQPVYAYVRRLADEKAVTVRKRGQRLLCEPAATPAGSLWLAQWSLREVTRSTSPLVGELAAVLGSPMGEATAAGAVVALDPGSPRGGLVYVTDAALAHVITSVPVRVASRAQLTDVLVGRDRGFELARRILPLCGQQLLWSLALAGRSRARTRPTTASRPRLTRRRAFID